VETALEADISTLPKTGHFYFALTRKAWRVTRFEHARNAARGQP
jgi:hypothetical protein